MVQQLFTSSQIQWKSQVMPGPARLNPALTRPMHRGPTLNHILPKLNNVQYLSFIDMSSGYHNLKLDKNHNT